MNALSIAAQLGLAPLPAKTATGRKHIPDGCLSVKSGGPIAEVRQKAADRRDYIVSELILSGPMTGAEIAEFTGANANTSAEDLKVLIEGGESRSASTRPRTCIGCRNERPDRTTHHATAFRDSLRRVDLAG